jgi:hypothetical protein
MTQGLWETRAVIPGMGGSSSHWTWGKACVAWTRSDVEDGRWGWVGLN